MWNIYPNMREVEGKGKGKGKIIVPDREMVLQAEIALFIMNIDFNGWTTKMSNKSF